MEIPKYEPQCLPRELADSLKAHVGRGRSIRLRLQLDAVYLQLVPRPLALSPFLSTRPLTAA